MTTTNELQKMREMLFPSQLQFLFSSPRAVKGVDSYSVNGYVRQEPDYRLPEVRYYHSPLGLYC